MRTKLYLFVLFVFGSSYQYFLLGQTLQKVHTFSYFMLDFDRFTQRYTTGDGLLVTYSSGPGVGSPQSTTLLVNKNGKVISIPEKEYDGVTVIDGDYAFNASTNKGKLVFRKYSFDEGGVINSLKSSNTIEELIKSAGGDITKKYSYYLRYIKILDHDNLLLKIHASKDDKYFNIIFKWDINNNIVQAVVPNTYPELKHDKQWDADEEHEWALLSYTKEHVFYYKRVYNFDKKEKRKGFINYHIAKYDFNGTLISYSILKSNEPGDKQIKLHAQPYSASYILSDNDNFYTITFTEAVNKPKAWIRKFNHSGILLLSDTYELERGSPFIIEKSSEHDFYTYIYEGIVQFKSTFGTKTVELLLDCNTLKRTTHEKENKQLMDAINAEIAGDKELKLIDKTKDILKKEKYYFVFLKGKGRTSNIFLYK